MLSALVACTITTAVAASVLTASQLRGRQIFHEGTRGSGSPIVALLGDAGAEIPGQTLRCRDCHGRRGKGSVEGGLSAPDIRPGALGHATDQNGIGRERPPYDRALLARAITTGVDPAGNRLHVGMPRYRMVASDLDDLLDYLHVLGSDEAPGVTAESISIGTVLPRQGALTEAASAIEDTLEALIDVVNGAGGVHGRKLSLVVEDSAEQGGAAAVRQLEARGVFALVANLGRDIADLEQQTEQARRAGLPLVGPLGHPIAHDPASRGDAFYLLAGIDEQVRRLVDHAADSGVRSLALVASDDALGATARTAFDDQLGLHGLRSAGTFNVSGALDALDASRPEAIALAVPPRQALALAASLRASSWDPQVLTLASLAGTRFLDLDAAAASKVVLAHPAPLPEEALPVFESAASFLNASAVGRRHFGFQLWALAAGQTLVEALRRSGRELGREELIESLESLNDFPTALAVPLSFGPNRRTGSRSTILVRPDPALHRLVPVAGRADPLHVPVEP